MTPLEKYAAKKALGAKLRELLASTKKSVGNFMTNPKHQTARRVAGGAVGVGAAALLAKKLLSSKAKVTSKAGLAKLLKQHKGKIIAGGAAGVGAAGLASLLKSNS